MTAYGILFCSCLFTNLEFQVLDPQNCGARATPESRVNHAYEASSLSTKALESSRFAY